MNLGVDEMKPFFYDEAINPDIYKKFLYIFYIEQLFRFIELFEFNINHL